MYKKNLVGVYFSFPRGARCPSVGPATKYILFFYSNLYILILKSLNQLTSLNTISLVHLEIK